jgi:hypothetical protein
MGVRRSFFGYHRTGLSWRIFDAQKKVIGTIEYRLSHRFYNLGPWVGVEGKDTEFYIAGGF